MLCVFPPPIACDSRKTDEPAPVPRQMAERSVHQREHAVGEVVLLKELRTVDLPLEKRIEAKNGGPSVGSSKDRRARFAECSEGSWVGVRGLI